MAASTTSRWRPDSVAMRRPRPASGARATDSIRSRTNCSRARCTSSSRSRSATATAASVRWRATRAALAGRASHAPRRAADAGGAHPLGDRVGREEAALHEVAQRLAELVLALGDDRRVRDRQAERVAEQGHHREPVGQPADHRRLGGRLQVAHPSVPAGHSRDGEHGGDDEEEGCRPPAHEHQPAGALVLGAQARQERIFPFYPTTFILSLLGGRERRFWWGGGRGGGGGEGGSELAGRHEPGPPSRRGKRQTLGGGGGLPAGAAAPHPAPGADVGFLRSEALIRSYHARLTHRGSSSWSGLTSC